MSGVKVNKKMFYEVLPRWGKGRHGGTTNWENSVNHDIQFIYKDIEGTVKIIKYEKDYIVIQYLDIDSFRINIDNFKDCRIGKLLGQNTSEYKIEIDRVLTSNNRNLTVIGRGHKKGKNGQNYKRYKYRCNVCTYEGDMEESNLLKGKGCSCCGNKKVKVGVNSIVDTSPWMIPYFQNPEDAKLYAKSSNKYIVPICPDCGRIKDKPMMLNTIYREHSIHCPCSDGKSYPREIHV